MEFLDEESRPRLMFQSRPSPTQSNPDSQKTLINLHKPTLFISISLSLILLTLNFLYLESEPLKSIIIWFSLSLLIGPFAPSSLTGGDIRVGLGPPINEQPNTQIDVDKKPTNRRSKSRKPDDELPTPVLAHSSVEKQEKNVTHVVVEEEKEWSEADLELLKKQMAKYPSGMPGRWEAVAGVFGGRHGVESVIKRVKFVGEKKNGGGDADSFSKFLKDRKPVDKRVDEGFVEEGGELKGWSGGEDLALLNALKAFPKDVGMRWEKISAAVPGKSKAECMKRVAELKKDFRTSKATTES